MSQNPELVHVKRGALVESVHRGAIAVASADGGNILATIGDVDSPVFARSAIKLFQAVPLIESGAADVFHLTEQELAVACASHSSQTMHISAVRSMLSKADSREIQLLCGIHWPLEFNEVIRIASERRAPTPIENTCSGKHAAFLSVCRRNDFNLSDYTSYEHPLQVEVRRVLSDTFGIASFTKSWAVDGCGVPTYAIPLRNLALGFAQLSDRSHSAPMHATARMRLLNACLRNPVYLGGDQRFVSLQMQQFGGELYLKDGAEGIYCGSLPKRGIGFALKCDDGADRAARVIADILTRSLQHTTNGICEIIGSILPAKPLLAFCMKINELV
jgi:L-asparaginase II